MSDEKDYRFTNADVLGEALQGFETLDSETQEIVADYIECPSSDDCLYDGDDDTCCAACKVKWLKEEWEDEDDD